MVYEFDSVGNVNRRFHEWTGKLECAKPREDIIPFRLFHTNMDAISTPLPETTPCTKSLQPDKFEVKLQLWQVMCPEIFIIKSSKAWKSIPSWPYSAPVKLENPHWQRKSSNPTLEKNSDSSLGRAVIQVRPLHRPVDGFKGFRDSRQSIKAQRTSPQT